MPSTKELRAVLAAFAVTLPLAMPVPSVAQDSGSTAATGSDAAGSGAAAGTTAESGAASSVDTAPSPADAETVVATVNGVDITLGHMILIRSALPQQYDQLPPEVLFQGILDQLVQQVVLSQSHEGDVPKRVDMALQNERNALMANVAIDQFLETAMPEDQIQAAYEEKYGNAEPEKEYKARHILVETEDEAKAVIEELKGGAEFAVLAQEQSTGPSGPNGGDLGWFGAGMMVPEFEEATMALEPGSFTETPVQTQFGWHVILLEEVRDQAAPTLDEVREELTMELQREAVEGHVDALTEKADIDRSGAEGVDPTLLTNSDLLQ